jgi:hypothetical protein
MKGGVRFWSCIGGRRIRRIPPASAEGVGGDLVQRFPVGSTVVLVQGSAEIHRGPAVRNWFGSIAPCMAGLWRRWSRPDLSPNKQAWARVPQFLSRVASAYVAPRGLVGDEKGNPVGCV